MKMFRRKGLRWISLGISFCLVAAVLPLTACGTDGEEQVLSMYVAYGGPDIIAAEFEKATGIKVELLTMSSRPRLRKTTLRPMYGSAVAQMPLSRPGVKD